MVLLALLLACGPAADPCLVAWSADALTVPVSPFLDVPGGRQLGAVPVRLKANPEVSRKDGGRSVALSAAGFTLLGSDGTPLPALTRDQLPLDVLVEAGAPGSGTLRAQVAGCDAVDLPLSAPARLPLAGRPAERTPGFAWRELFGPLVPLWVGLDPALGPALAGDVYVVPHRSPADWAADPALADLSGGVERWEVQGEIGATEVWASPAPGAGILGSAVDLVLDADGDGALSPGDVRDAGALGEGLQLVADLAGPGPWPVATADVSGGDWLGQRVWWPEGHPAGAPLVVVSHGNGHDYTWYDYLGEHLASWGFVVMSHQNQTQPGIESASTTTLANTEWFLAEGASVAGTPIVDARSIGWIGHSRGGEGVVRAYARLREGEFVPEQFAAEDVRVIASIAPTVFYEVDVSDPHDVRFHLLAGSADGDVTGQPGYPEALSFRLLAAAEGDSSSTYLYGASHEDFNCCGYDDGDGPDQLDREVVHALAKAHLLAVMADGLLEAPAARGVLAADPARLPLTDAGAVVISTWKPVEALIIDDFQATPDPLRASSGAPVTTDVEELYEASLADLDGLLAWSEADPMNGMTEVAYPSDDARGVVFGWQQEASYAYELPSSVSDWSGRRWLSFRACQGTRHPYTVELDGPLDLSVTLVDGAGVAVTVPAAIETSIAPSYQRRGRGTGDGRGWVNAWSTVRLPLDDFRVGGVPLDLADIRELRFELGGAGDAPLGRLGLDDIRVEP